MSKRIIDGFSEFYGYNYADSFGPNGAKTDQVGVPDFAAGAMENWGLVIYQTYLVYIKPEESYESSVLSTASGINRKTFSCSLCFTPRISVIAHELQHQWTGNLITCTWWDEIWINEAFADFGGYLGLRWAEPEWDWKAEFFIDEFTVGLRADHTITSRPLINKD